jgi:hypothetical protein
MNAPFLVYTGPNGVSVVNSEQVICFNVSKVVALAAVVEMFGPAFDLSNEVDAATFRTTLQQATQSTLAAVESTVEVMEETAEVQRLRRLLLLTHNAVSELTAEIAREVAAIESQNQLAKEQEARRVAMVKQQELQRHAVAKAQAAQRVAAQAEADRQLNRKVTVNSDGTVDVTESAHDTRFKSARKLVARYKTVDDAPESVRSQINAN